MLGKSFKKAKYLFFGTVPEHREKSKTLWAREDWGIYLADLWAPPRASSSPASCPIPILQTIITDIFGIK